jgi:hypothetical protein
MCRRTPRHIICRNSIIIRQMTLPENNTTPFKPAT